MTNNRCVGRPCIGSHPMTDVERKRRQREKLHPRMEEPKWIRKHHKITKELNKIRVGKRYKPNTHNQDKLRELKALDTPQDADLVYLRLRKPLLRQYYRRQKTVAKGSLTRVRCYVFLSRLLTNARLHINLRY